MKTKQCVISGAALLLFLISTLNPQLSAFGQGTAFSYQGHLNQGTTPANGSYDLTFSLFGASSGGTAIAGPLTSSAVAVNNGVFTVTLDFGNHFDGSPRFLEISVSPSGAGTFTTLSPRQPLNPTPYAIFAGNASVVSPGSVVQSLNSLKDNVTLAAGANVTISPSGNTLTIASAGVGGSGIWSLNGASTYYNGGGVGIGTSSPKGALQLANGGLAVTGASSPFNGAGQGIFMESHPAGGYLFAFDYGSYNPRPLILNSPGGNVGIGTTTPAENLTIANVVGPGSGLKLTGVGLNGIGMAIENTYPGGHKYDLVSGDFYIVPPGTIAGAGDFRIIDETANVGDRFVITGDGNVGINIANPQATLDVNGTLHVGNNASVCTLTIRGGCDLAEPFPTSEVRLDKGAVVVIDEEHPGQLKLSDRAYDTRVAGIVSGANGINPGISLHQQGAMDAGQDVALSGRVYVQADASFGAIKPGDLLTTSDTPGHAMRVADHTRALGAILGKAMTGLGEGKGMVLVLVTLQ